MTQDADLGKKFDKAVFPGSQGGPLEHVIAAKAVAFGEALQDEFKTYSPGDCQRPGHGHPIAIAGPEVVSNGTDNHLLLVDLRSISMTGKRADQLMGEINITSNKNTVPFDPESPFVTSGLRLGSPAMTTRGMGADEFTEIANIIADCLINPEDEAVKQDCRRRVASLCDRFPLYPHLRTPEPALA
jgi:glycine hydroxymethyltransferase